MNVNTFKTAILLATMGAIAVAIGAFFFHGEGAIIGLLIAFVFQGASYFYGDKMALAAARATPLQPGQIPWLEEMASDLAMRAEIPAPHLYISPDPQPNAFAAGRDPHHSVVCVNVGLIERLSRNEVMAVLGHEFGHIKNRDILTMTVAAACATMITFAARLGVWFGFGGGDRDRNPITELLLLILAPVAAMVIQLAISRQREFAADRASAKFLGSPTYMISALQSLEKGTAWIPSTTAQSGTAHMYIASPLSGRGLLGLFSTHPPMEERIARLREVA